MHDRVWSKLRLDDVASKPDVDPSTISGVTAPFELLEEERDKLIDWLAATQLGSMRRLLSEIDRMLIRSRDGDAEAKK